jgi:ligand-binding sensor domain-containing protein
MLWLLAAALIVRAPQPPSVPAPAGPSYSLDVWEVDDGLPQNSVVSMIQTRDGYLWIGTWAGVVRFDGVRFTPVAADLPNNHILALAEHPDGSVWIGTGGGGVARWERHATVLFTTANGLAHDEARGLAIDGDGRVWVGTLGGVSVIDGRAVVTPSMAPGSTPIGEVHAMATSPAGRIWFGIGDGGICDARDLVVTCRTVAAEKPITPLLLLPTGDGEALIGLPDRIATWTGAAIVDWPACGSRCRSRVPSLLYRARDGAVWAGLGAEGGVVRFDGTTRTIFDSALGLPANTVRKMLEDREGSLWLGTDGGGLVRLRKTRLTMLGMEHGLSSRVVTSIVEDAAGTIWAGGRCAPLSALGPDGRFQPRLVEVTGRGCVVSVLAASDGTLWFGVDRAGVYGWRDGALRHIGADTGLSSDTVASLFEDRDGAIWIGTDTASAHRLRGDRLDTFGPDQDLPSGRIVSFAEDREGRLWLGSNANGLFLYEQGRFRHFGEAEGLPTRLVSTLRVDSRGDLWIGTANRGLYRKRDGRFEHFGVEHGLPDPVVALTIEDLDANIWVATSHGISRLARDRIEAVARGDAASLDPIVLGKADGLRSLEGSGGGFDPAGLRDREGRLWFSTLDGIAVIDPATLPLNQVPPPVAIEHVTLDDAASRRPVAGEVQVPAGTRGVEIAYTAFSLLAPNRVRFRYRLAGFDGGWHEVAGRRSAFYTNLPPATYTFEVLAANNDGVWSTAPARLQLTVAPLWWQRRPIQALALGLMLVMTGAVARAASLRRARARLAELEREQALSVERSRIARDLHDDIGTRLTYLALLADRSAEKGMRAELSTTARETARTMDELVWSVNATNDTLEGLLSYVMRFTERHARAAGLRCRIEAPATVEAHPLAADARRHVFLAIKEAVNNAVKHANASALSIGVTVSHGVLEVSVADDGRGFGTEQSAGNGLNNMRDRMAAVGGSAAVESGPGRGTTVRFRVPLHGNGGVRMPMR